MPVLNSARVIDSCGNTAAQPNLKTCSVAASSPPRTETERTVDAAFAWFFVIVFVVAVVAHFAHTRR